MVELFFPAKVEKLDEVIDFINTNIGDMCKNSVELASIDIAVEEVFVNIASYAYEKDQEGDAIIRIAIDKNSSELVIQFMDRGMPFNPLAQEEPDTTTVLNERQVGGLGILIVKRSMDKVTYKYKDGMNILTVIKRLNKKS